MFLTSVSDSVVKYTMTQNTEGMTREAEANQRITALSCLLRDTKLTFTALINGQYSHSDLWLLMFPLLLRRQQDAIK
jgi:hypothetical protein